MDEADSICAHQEWIFSKRQTGVQPDVTLHPEYLYALAKQNLKTIQIFTCQFTENTWIRWTHRTPGNDQLNSERKKGWGINYRKDSRGHQVNAACGLGLDSDSSKPTGEKHLRHFRDLNMEMLTDSESSTDAKARRLKNTQSQLCHSIKTKGKKAVYNGAIRWVSPKPNDCLTSIVRQTDMPPDAIHRHPYLIIMSTMFNLSLIMRKSTRQIQIEGLCRPVGLDPSKCYCH